MGPEAGKGRLPRRLRPVGAENPLQDPAGRPPGGRRHPPLRPHGHRQLQRLDRPDLHRYRRFDLQGAVRHATPAPCSTSLTGYSRPAPTTTGLSPRRIDMRPFFERDDRGRDLRRRRAASRAGSPSKVNSLVDPGHHRAACIRRVPGGGAGQADRPRHLLPDPRRTRKSVSENITRPLRSSASSSSTAGSSSLNAAESPASGWAAPTGCSATSTTGSNWSSRSTVPSSRTRAEEILDVMWNDNVNTRVMQPDTCYLLRRPARQAGRLCNCQLVPSRIWRVPPGRKSPGSGASRSSRYH